MTHYAQRILAIDPGTRHLGVALLDHGDLLYYGVRDVHGARRDAERLFEGRKALSRLLDDLRPSLVAVEKTFFGDSPNAVLLNALASDIGTMAQQRSIPVVRYAPSSVKKFITGYGHATKKEVARALAAWHPELRVFLNQDRAWKERYHQNMFDAVAVGMMAHLRDDPPICA